MVRTRAWKVLTFATLTSNLQAQTFGRETRSRTLPRTRPVSCFVNFAVNSIGVVHGKVDGIDGNGVVLGKVHDLMERSPAPGTSGVRKARPNPQVEDIELRSAPFESSPADVR